MRELLALPGRVGVGHRGRPEMLLKLSTEGGHESLLKLSHNRCRATNQTEKKKKKFQALGTTGWSQIVLLRIAKTQAILAKTQVLYLAVQK